jgi:hypothetical protein
MRTRFLAAAFVACSIACVGSGDDLTPQRQRERQIEQRDQAANGIVVEEPKVYDDSMLQQMLAAAQARLAALQPLDQASIVNRFGAVSGVDQRANSFAITAQTPALPQVVTTEKGPSGSTVGTVKDLTSSETGTGVTSTSKDTSSTDRSTQTTSGLATRDVATTASAFAVPTATAAAPSLAMPSGIGISASDMLNEQLQLTYEIANLRLLLEGSLSDRMLNSSKERLVKPRTTISIPVTLRPDNRHKNAVAIIEVEVEKIGDIGEGEKPAITALLPREKTYNVAAITESSASIGGGLVTQVIGLGGSWLRSHKTYYVVQDQDTLALTFQPETPGRTGFLWQFRPVLGREYVKSGEKHNFVQLAFPTSFSAPHFGNIFVRTYWRKYDRRKGILKEVLRDSLKEDVIQWKIRNYQLAVDARGFGASSLEDMGDGQILVKLTQRFLSSTYVRIGNTIVREGAGLTFEHSGIRFAARLIDLVSKHVALVSRDGSETPLLIQRPLGPAGSPGEPPRVKSHRLSAIDESSTQLTLELEDARHLNVSPPLVIVAGGKVFGYADAPIERKNRSLTAVIPTALLISQPEVTVTWLFADPRMAVRRALPEFSAVSRAEQLIVLEQRSSSAKFLLYGSRLGSASVLAPEKVELKPFGRPEDRDTLKLLEIPAAQIKAHRRLVLARPNERPVLVDIPAVEFKDAPRKELAPRGRISLGSDEALFEGEGLQKLTRVLFRNRAVPFDPAADGKSVRLKNLKTLGVTSSAVPQDLIFVFEEARTPVTIEVVNARYETIAN